MSEFRIDSYKGMRSIVADNGLIRVEVVPALGGKLVSLVYKPTGKEWLLDSGSRSLQAPVYGSAFTEGDMSGWDECFPTIDACTTRARGIRLPDHGEVWSLPWDFAIQGSEAVCSVKGVAQPYRLTRTMSLAGDARVRLAYEAHNIEDEPISFLWAAHPQFQVDETTRILLPDEMESLLCVYGGLHHTAGKLYSSGDIDLVNPRANGDGMKFYYPGKVSHGWSGLHGQETGNYLLLSVSEDSVPYWGVWIDRGMFNDRTAVALEPGIGYYDSLAMAESNGSAGLLNPGQKLNWEVNIVLGTGDWTLDL